MRRYGVHHGGTEARRRSIEDALDTILQDGNVEVDQKACGTAGQFQVRQKLRCMNGHKGCDTLYFDNYQVLDDEVEPIAAIEVHRLVDERKGLLPFEASSGREELITQTRLVR